MIRAKQKVGHDLFGVLMKRGRVFNSEHFSLRVLLTDSKQGARFSVVVAKKIDKNAKSAVWRNTLKRQIYKILHSLLPLAKAGSLAVFFIKKKAEKKNLSKLDIEIFESLKRAGVVN